MEVGKIYHVYNRGNNREQIFIQERNFEHFMFLYEKYLGEVATLLAYCLMPNHFHWLIQIKEEDTKLENKLSITERLRRLFMSYSKAINNQQLRVGSLFQKNVKSKPVEHLDYLKIVFAYIHYNPIAAMLGKEYADWKYCSYTEFTCSDWEHKNFDNEVVKLCFNSKEEFIAFHEHYKMLRSADGIHLPSLKTW